MAVCAGITYNAGTNLIATAYVAGDGTKGASFTLPYTPWDWFDTDVANGWGIVDNVGTHFRVRAKVSISGNTTYFEAKGCSVYIDPSTSSQDVLTLSQTHVRLGVASYGTNVDSTFALKVRDGGSFNISNLTGGSFQAINTNFVNIISFIWAASAIYTQTLQDCNFYNCGGGALRNSSSGFSATRIKIVGGVSNFGANITGTLSDLEIIGGTTQISYIYAISYNLSFRNIDVSLSTGKALFRLQSVSVFNFINSKRNSESPFVSFTAAQTNKNVTINFISEFTLLFNLTGVNYKIYDKNNNIVKQGTADNTVMEQVVYYYENGYTLATTVIVHTIFDLNPFKVVLSKEGYQTLEVPGINVIEGQPTIIRAKLEEASFASGLKITAIEITDVTTAGGSDGALIVTAGGGIEPYEYSLNGTDYQVSNIFSGLSAGEYTVYVKDGEDTVASFAVEISDPGENNVYIDQTISGTVTPAQITGTVTPIEISGTITIN